MIFVWCHSGHCHGYVTVTMSLWPLPWLCYRHYVTLATAMVMLPSLWPLPWLCYRHYITLATAMVMLPPLYYSGPLPWLCYRHYITLATAMVMLPSLYHSGHCHGYVTKFLSVSIRCCHVIAV